MPIASSIGGGRGGALSLNLTGATAATRYAGGTTTGAPTTGTFAAGDHIVSQDGRLWICLVAGTPGTWRASDGLVFAQSLTADTATLDTGASVVPGGFSVLEVLLYLRTDETAVTSTMRLRFNGDATGTYDYEIASIANTTNGGAPANAVSGVGYATVGASAAASVYGAVSAIVPGYANTTGNKAGYGMAGVPDQTAANMRESNIQFAWRNTAAINQVTAVITSGTTQKFKAGSSMYVYVR